MEVIYKKSIIERIQKVKSEAVQAGKEIEKIILDETEWWELQEWFNSIQPAIDTFVFSIKSAYTFVDGLKVERRSTGVVI